MRCYLKLFSAFLFLALSFPVFAGQKVILDTDPAIGYFMKDIDDGLAMAVLLNSPEIELFGICSSYGNHNQSKTYAKAVEIVELAGSSVPVFRGAERPGEYGQTPASAFIRDTVLSAPGEVTIVAIGTTTNLAAAITSDPEVGPAVKAVISMGGAMKEKFLGLPVNKYFELNWSSDAEATITVVESVPEFVMISMDLCMEVIFTKKEFKRFKAEAPFLRDYLAKEIKPWLKLNRLLFKSEHGRGFYPWDVLAVEYLLEPEIFEPNPVKLKVIPEARGMTLDFEQGVNINAPMRLNEDRFWELFFERV